MMYKNWSEIVSFTPKSLHTPNTEAELVEIVKQCHAENRRVRVVGSGHSFTRLIETNDVLISLDNLKGLISADKNNMQVTVWAGTKIKTLGGILASQGMSQENLGDIDVQSIAGAISTGTHGSGVTLGSLATQVISLRIITANGEIITCSATENADIFKAAQVSLGLLGIITQVTLQCVPAYTLDYQWYSRDFDDVLADLDTLKQNRNFEFFWMPHTETTLVKTMNHTEKPPQPKSFLRRFNENVIENAVFWAFGAWVRQFPRHSKRIAQIIAGLTTDGHDVSASNEAFATVRMVKFQEMEYNIPAKHFEQCLQEIKDCISNNDIDICFPIECRFVAADDIPLSPAYQRESAYIAVHQFKRISHEAYFAQIEAIFRKYEGRPHWGKLHTRTVDELRALYPCWDQFMDIRQQLDPEGMFLNDYLQSYIK